jgi:hypothetical protein cdivTM_02536
LIEIDSAISCKDVLNIVNPKTGELRHSLMTLKVEGRVKLTSDKYEFTVSDGMVARMAAAILWLSALFIVQG